MAVVQITIDNGCDGCFKKDKTAREGVTQITLAGRTWYLCEEHETKFAAQFTELMGEGETQ
ncbi:hypothetical protein ACFWNC_14530 [Streptomyces sp. NPDC058369]|uniref:hypothetical protein n=1 Tax=Streptomyces sp. NPDC058369 TaxID=3346462 RepID=UPI00364FEF83